MKVFTLKGFTASAMGFALALSAFAQMGLAQMKIGVIDMQGALLSTTEGKKAAEELKVKYGPKEAEFNKRGQDLGAKQDQLRKGANTMSEEAKASADREIAA